MDNDVPGARLNYQLRDGLQTTTTVSGETIHRYYRLAEGLGNGTAGNVRGYRKGYQEIRLASQEVALDDSLAKL